VVHSVTCYSQIVKRREAQRGIARNQDRFSTIFPIYFGPARSNSWTDAIKIVNSPEIMHRARFTTATKNRSLLYKIMVLQRRAQTHTR